MTRTQTCPIDLRITPRYRADLEQVAVDAHVGRRRVGSMYAILHPDEPYRSKWRPFFGVFDSHVQASLRHCGIGTRLYQAAAREACRQGYPLASDDNLTDASRGFWEKQVRKGRATLRQHGYGKGRYHMSCSSAEFAGGPATPVSSRCELEVERAAGGYRDQTFDVTCRVDGVVTGRMSVWRQEEAGHHVMAVTSAIVYESQHLKRRRRGLGTQMYEAAAATACDTFGLPLASDKSQTRSRPAEGFWKKQARKKRATCIGESGGKRCRRWMLTCPPPNSLAAAPEIEPLIQAEERELARWATERGALIDHDGRVLQRWRGTKTRLRIPLEDQVRFPGRIFTHSHPPTTFIYDRNNPLRSFKSGASLSPQDGYMAATLDVAELRVVTKVPVDGQYGQTRTVVYRIQRPAAGWPPARKVKDKVDAAVSAHRRVLANKLRRREVEYENVATAAADEGWKTAAPKLGIKYDSVMLDGAHRRRSWLPWLGLAILVAIPFVPSL